MGNLQKHRRGKPSTFKANFGRLRLNAERETQVKEPFGANNPEENVTLKMLQFMPVNQRRHATIVLIGNAFQTFTPMEAFQHSVHAVINSSEMFLLKQLVEKAVADNTMFSQSYRDVQARIFRGETRS
jgi:hypothetical protein